MFLIWLMKSNVFNRTDPVQRSFFVEFWRLDLRTDVAVCCLRWFLYIPRDRYLVSVNNMFSASGTGTTVCSVLFSATVGRSCPALFICLRQILVSDCFCIYRSGRQYVIKPHSPVVNELKTNWNKNRKGTKEEKLNLPDCWGSSDRPNLICICIWICIPYHLLSVSIISILFTLNHPLSFNNHFQIVFAVVCFRLWMPCYVEECWLCEFGKRARTHTRI